MFCCITDGGHSLGFCCITDGGRSLGFCCITDGGCSLGVLLFNKQWSFIRDSAV